MTAAAGYIRVSTRKQADGGYSLDEQRAAVVARCKAEGWDLTLYEDAGLSAAEGKHRPALEKLLADAERGAFDLVVFRDLDRVGRSVVDLSRIVGGLERVRIVTLEGRNVDRSTAEGKLQFNVLASVAEYERAKIGERVSGSARSRAARGLFPGGRRMKYGYRRRGKDEAPEIVETEAAVVRRIYNNAAAGMSQRHITIELNRDGIKTQQGSKWEQGTVARILRDPTYKGSITIKGETVFEGGSWAIIDPDLWDRVAVLKAARDKAPGSGRGRRPSGAFLFMGGLLRCGECGTAMSPRTYPSGRQVYVCRLHYVDREACSQMPVERALVDEKAFDYFERVGLDVEATREQMHAATVRKLADLAALRSGVDRDLLTKSDALGRLEGDYERGEISGATFERMYARVSDDLSALEAQREQFATQEAQIRAERVEGDEELHEQLASIRAAIQGKRSGSTSLDAVRAALTLLFEWFEYETGCVADDPALRYQEVWPLFRTEAMEFDGDRARARRIPLALTETMSPTACSSRLCLSPIPLHDVEALA